MAWMDFNHLSLDVRDRVDQYYELAYPQRQLFDEESVIGNLPRSLKAMIYRDMYSTALAGVSFLPTRQNKMAPNDQNARSIRTYICDKIQKFAFLAGDVIAGEGDRSGNMYIILHGQIGVYSKGIKISTAYTGAVIGERGLFVDSRRSRSFVAHVFTRTLSLGREDIMEILEQFPNYSQSIIKWLEDHRDKLLHKNDASAAGADSSKQDMPAATVNRSKAAKRSKAWRNGKGKTGAGDFTAEDVDRAIRKLRKRLEGAEGLESLSTDSNVPQKHLQKMVLATQKEHGETLLKLEATLGRLAQQMDRLTKDHL